MIKGQRGRVPNEDSHERGGTERLAPDAALQQLTFDINGVIELIGGDSDPASPEIRRVLSLVAGLLREALDRLEPVLEESIPLPQGFDGSLGNNQSERLPEVQVLSLRDLLTLSSRANGFLRTNRGAGDAAIEAQFAIRNDAVPTRRPHEPSR